MVGVPTLDEAGTGTPGAAVAELAAPPRVAIRPATAPPATAATTTIHFLRPGTEGERAAAAPPLGSATYWNETIPARACSFDARIRIWNRPGTRLATRPRRTARPPASVTTT